MKPIDAFYERLALFDGSDADQVLGAALEFAEPGWFERLESILARRTSEVAKAALLGCHARLSPAVKSELEADPKKLTGWLAGTMRLSSAGMRESALGLIHDRCITSLAYVLPPALRDSVGRNRMAAAKALVTLAGRIRDGAARRNPDAPVDPAAQEDQKRLVLAIREALRSFERYPQVEILRVACWFARELGSPFLKMLELHNGKVGGIVFRLMDDWDEPAMAYFLIRMLGTQWRLDAARRLAKWSRPAHLAALLGTVDAIEGTAVCEGMRMLRRVHWFDEVDGQFSEIPAHLRGNVQTLIDATGLRSEAKAALIEAGSRQPGGLQSATEELLQKLRAECVSEEPGQPEGQASNDAQPGATLQDFNLLWDACRKLPAAKRGQMIELLRSQAGPFAEGLRAKLTEGDARDRVLGLQVVGTRELGARFLEDLEKLRSDTVDAIRALANGAVEELRRCVDEAAADAPAAVEVRAAEALDPAAVRSQLDQKLRELAEDATRGASAEFVTQLQATLRSLHAACESRAEGVAHVG